MANVWRCGHCGHTMRGEKPSHCSRCGVGFLHTYYPQPVRTPFAVEVLFLFMLFAVPIVLWLALSEAGKATQAQWKSWCLTHAERILIGFLINVWSGLFLLWTVGIAVHTYLKRRVTKRLDIRFDVALEQCFTLKNWANKCVGIWCVPTLIVGLLLSVVTTGDEYGWLCYMVRISEPSLAIGALAWCMHY